MAQRCWSEDLDERLKAHQLLMVVGSHRFQKAEEKIQTQEQKGKALMAKMFLVERYLEKGWEVESLKRTLLMVVAQRFREEAKRFQIEEKKDSMSYFRLAKLFERCQGDDWEQVLMGAAKVGSNEMQEAEKVQMSELKGKALVAKVWLVERCREEC